MWAYAQPDGRPAEYRWRHLFNAAKFGWRPLLECRTVTLPRRDTRWNMTGCPKPANWSQPLVGRSSPYRGDMWRRYCCLTGFFSIVDTYLTDVVEHASYNTTKMLTRSYKVEHKWSDRQYYAESLSNTMWPAVVCGLQTYRFHGPYVRKINKAYSVLGIINSNVICIWMNVLLYHFISQWYALVSNKLMLIQFGASLRGYWTTRGCHRRLCVLSFPVWRHLRVRELSSPRVGVSASCPVTV